MRSPPLRAGKWLRKNLAAAPLGAKVVFAMRMLPTEENLALFASYGAKAELSGHWHGHRVRESGGIVDMNSPPLQFSRIDRFPRGFCAVRLSGSGEVDNETRLGGFKGLGSYNLGVPIASSPMNSGDTPYIGGYDGNLYAFALRG